MACCLLLVAVGGWCAGAAGPQTRASLAKAVAHALAQTQQVAPGETPAPPSPPASEHEPTSPDSGDDRATGSPADPYLVALTFNDGPDDRVTPRLLDLLARHNVQATFFITGVDGRRHPDIVRRMAREGHRVENHGWSHTPLHLLDDGAGEEEIEATARLIDRLTGRRSTLFRPPGAGLHPQVLAAARRQDHQVVLWTNVGAESLPGVSAQDLVRWLQNPHPGAVLMLHATNPEVLEALTILLPRWQQKGIQFVTLTPRSDPPAGRMWTTPVEVGLTAIPRGPAGRPGLGTSLVGGGEPLMSYFLRAAFLVDALTSLESGLRELDAILNDQDINSEFAQLQALLAKRASGAELEPLDGNAREAWQRVRQGGRLVRELLATAERAGSLLRAMPCEPLLFTGSGNTDNVLRALNHLLSEQPVEPSVLRELGIDRSSTT